MARLSGAAVLLILVVPLFMYTCALFVGIQVGRALEKSPDSDIIISVKGLVEFFAKDLWDIERRGRDFVGHDARVQQFVPAGRRVGRSFTHSRPRFARTGYEGEEYAQPNRGGTPKARSYNRNHTSPREVLRVCSPCAVGGRGGQGFDMRVHNVSHLHSITLYHSSVIHSLACDYSIAGDEANRVSAGPWGVPHSYGSIAARATINLSAGEHLTAVEGTSGKAPWNLPSSVITSLTFRTNLGRTYGPYGGESGTRFTIPATGGSCIVGFWGRSGWLLDAIGIYSKPSCSSNRTNSYPYARDQNLVHDG